MFDFEYHILVEPFVHPFAERHAAFFGEVDAAVEVDKQMKLFQRRFLALSEHRFIHRRGLPDARKRRMMIEPLAAL